MEPRREEPTAPTPQPQEKPRRFRIVKLEERIAPLTGGGGSHHCPTGLCHPTVGFCIHPTPP
jgi:hypothetical protein